MAIRQLTDLDALKEYLAPPSLRDIDEIVLHHTWSPNTREYRGLSTWQGIDYYHQHTRGWHRRGPEGDKDAIGYHLGLDPEDGIWKLRHYSYAGCGVLNRNRNNIHVALIGNFDDENPAPYLPVAARVVRVLCDRFNIAAGDIRFHREFADKSCPGTRIKLSAFRDMVFNAGGGNPEDDTEPNIRTLGVVLGGSFIECEPRLVGGRLAVDGRNFSEPLLRSEWMSIRSEAFYHPHTKRMFITDAAPWFEAQGWIIDGRVWRQEQAGGITVKRLYPSREEWMA